MALALVNSQGGTAASSSAPVYTVTSTGTASGTGLILVVGWETTTTSSQTVTSITDNQSNTWTKAAASNAAGSKNKADLWHVDPSTYVSGVTAITVNFSQGSTSAWFFYEVSGGSTSWADKASSTSTGTTTAPTASVTTLTQAAEFAAAGISWADTTVTISGLTAGWSADTLETGTNDRLQAAHQITAATTALTYAGTLSSSPINGWADVVATFKEAAAPAFASPLFGIPFGSSGQRQMTQLLGY